MENVDRAEKSKAFERARAIFKEAGYGLTQMVLDASKCDVPQKRKRFFCIGAVGQKDDFMKEGLVNGMNEKSTTLRDYFGDTLGIEFYYRHPRNYSRRAVFSIDESAPTMRRMNRPVPKGYPGHPKDACPISNEVRALTTLECSLIQTFPASFKWCGNKTDMEQMIGNAVPVKLAEYVALRLKEYVKSQEQVEVNKDAFVGWLIDAKNYTPRTARDTLSRVRRADKICPLDGVPDDFYICLLQQSNEYSELSASIRSQIKRALALYRQFAVELGLSA